jgi:hypothetical protein
MDGKAMQEVVPRQTDAGTISAGMETFNLPGSGKGNSNSTRSFGRLTGHFNSIDMQAACAELVRPIA